MSENELIIKKEDAVILADAKNIGEIIKPLTQEIHLFNSYIAGTSYIKDPTVFDEITVTSKLRLQRENNKFDESAILLLTENGKKAGYIPEKDNVIFARLMDAGKLLSAKVTGIEKKGSFIQIRIGIYLVDF